MKPMIIISPGLIDAENIKLLRENEICVVIVKDPSKVKFVDPIPAASQRGKIEDAAIRFTRIMLNCDWGRYFPSGAPHSLNRTEMCKVYAQLLINETLLAIDGGPEGREKQFAEQVKAREIERLAREEARAQHASKKAETAQAKKKDGA